MKCFDTYIHKYVKEYGKNQQLHQKDLKILHKISLKIAYEVMIFPEKPFFHTKKLGNIPKPGYFISFLSNKALAKPKERITESRKILKTYIYTYICTKIRHF